MKALRTEQIAARWDLSSRTYDDWANTHPACTRAWIDTMTELVGDPRREGSRALRTIDVGTGTGHVALPLAEMGHDVTGYDYFEPNVEDLIAGDPDVLIALFEASENTAEEARAALLARSEISDTTAVRNQGILAIEGLEIMAEQLAALQ